MEAKRAVGEFIDRYIISVRIPRERETVDIGCKAV